MWEIVRKIINRAILGIIISVMIIPQAHQANASMLATGISGDNALSPYETSSEEVDVYPQAIIKVRNNSGNRDQYSGTTATTFLFDGSGSRDEETPASNLEVRFDFENDGQIDTYFSVIKNVKHKFETPGLKTVRMEVLDRAGNVSEATTYVKVVSNTPPYAYFEVNPSIGTPGTKFHFDAYLSTDSQYQSRLLEYRWDFNNDGTFDTKFTSNHRLKHHFKTPGLRKVILEVKDPEGARDYYSQMVMIKQNTPPTATFEIETRDIDENKGTFKLDAGNSYDPDGSKLKYRWDFNYTGNNDIQYNTTWYNSSITYARFYRSGEYIIKLLTKDIDGAIQTSFGKIQINLTKE